jgi:signal transduction histidine kinase
MMNLRAKLLLGFGSLLSLLVVVSVLSIIVITFYTHEIERVLSENYNSVVYGQKMRESVDQLTFQAQDVVYGGVAMDRAFAQRQSDAKQVFVKNLEEEHGNLTVPGEPEAEQTVRRLWDEGFQPQLAHVLNADSTDLQRRRDYATLLQARNDLNDAAQKIIDMNLENMVSVDGQARAWANRSRAAVYVILAAGVLIGSILIALAGKWILHPLRSLTRSVKEIESGNLNLVVPVRTRDEVGQLAEAFNAMTATLREFRRTDQAKLLRTQQTTQLAIDSLPDAVAVISPEGAIEMANGTARRLFNLQPETLVSASRLDWLIDLFHAVRDHQRPHDPQGYQNALQVFDNGTERFFLPHGIPIQDEGHHLVGVTLVLVDVTRLRQLDEVKSSLVATVSHELRTPLTGIRLANHLLLSERIGSLSTKQMEVVIESRDNADRLQKIIENLLDMSRIESGSTPLDLAPVAPHELAHEAADQVRVAMQGKGIDFQVDVPVELPRVQVDRARIGHVLGNLLNNALRYTPAGGQITLAATVEGDHLVCSVRDTGQGIPKDYQARVFERFFRVPGQNSPGVGLGLAIAKEIVLLHGGTIGVESQEGVGTTFHFTLPLVKTALVQEAAL